MLLDPVWEPLGEVTAWMQIHKDNGRLFWNMKVQQYLGVPESVKFEHDDELNWIGILHGFEYAVVEDEDGNFYIDAKEALEDFGLEFPLDEHITFEPEAPQDSHNRVVVEFE